mgnify:CR=1 FL=1
MHFDKNVSPTLIFHTPVKKILQVKNKYYFPFNNPAEWIQKFHGLVIRKKKFFNKSMRVHEISKYTNTINLKKKK